MLSPIVRNIRAMLAVYFSRNMLVCAREVRRTIAAPVLLRTVGTRVADLHSPDSAYRPHNGSVLRTASGWLVAVRGINYDISWLMNRLIVQGGPYHVESVTWMFELDESFGIVRTYTLDDTPFRGADGIAKNGLEDPRLFAWKGGTYALWSAGRVLTNDWENVQNTMVLAEIRGQEISGLTPLPSPHGAVREKNWMPWCVGDELRFVYSISKMEVYTYGDGGLTLHHKNSSADPRLQGASGGSQVMPWGDDYLCVVHYAARATRTASAKLVRFFYIHRFVVLTAECKVKAISREFFLERKGPEFCAGLSIEQEYVVLSYSVNDSASRLMKVPRKAVEDMLK